MKKSRCGCWRFLINASAVAVVAAVALIVAVVAVVMAVVVAVDVAVDAVVVSYQCLRVFQHRICQKVEKRVAEC